MMINICGTWFGVDEQENLYDNDGALSGQIDMDRAEIHLDVRLSEEAKNATLCHEVLHGLLENIGRSDLSNDEQFVTALGNAINGAFKVKEQEHG